MNKLHAYVTGALSTISWVGALADALWAAVLMTEATRPGISNPPLLVAAAAGVISGTALQWALL